MAESNEATSGTPARIQIPGGQFTARTTGLARKLAQAWAYKNIPARVANQATGWQIAVSRSGIDKA
jgi:hypothetical protein